MERSGTCFGSVCGLWSGCVFGGDSWIAFCCGNLSVASICSLCAYRVEYIIRMLS